MILADACNPVGVQELDSMHDRCVQQREWHDASYDVQVCVNSRHSVPEPACAVKY